MLLFRWQHHVIGKSPCPSRAKATWLRVAMDRSGTINEFGMVGGRKTFSTSSDTMMAAPPLLRCVPKLFEKDLTDRGKIAYAMPQWNGMR